MMKRIAQRIVLPLAAASLTVWSVEAAAPAPASAPAAAKPAKPTDLFGDSVVAKGKGVSVKRSQLDEEVIRYKSQAAGRGRPISPDQTTELEQYILNQMIQVQLLGSKATDADKAEGKKLAEKQLADTEKQLGSAEALNRELKLIGATREELLTKWTELAAAEMVLKRELKVNITDEDAKKYYDDNPSRFEQPEMVRASHILLGIKDPKTQEELSAEKKAAKHKQAEELLQRARAGEDFAKLAREFSDDPGSKDKGGEYTFGRGQMVKEFETAAFALNTNQVSDIVTTEYGYHIIKLSEKIPARKLELAKVSADLKEGLTRQALQKELPGYVEKLKQEAGVEILEEKLKPKQSNAPASAAGAPGKADAKPATK